MQGLVQDAGPGKPAPCSPKQATECPSHAPSSITRRLRPHHVSPATPPSATQRTPRLPAPAVETYTAHSTAIPAVKFNKVYPTPCTAVPSIGAGAASDKRCSFGRARERGDPVRIAQVASDPRDVPVTVRLGDLGGTPCERIGVARDQDDAMPAPRQRMRQGAPQALRRTGHQDSFRHLGQPPRLMLIMVVLLRRRKMQLCEKALHVHPDLPDALPDDRGGVACWRQIALESALHLGVSQVACYIEPFEPDRIQNRRGCDAGRPGARQEAWASALCGGDRGCGRATARSGASECASRAIAAMSRSCRHCIPAFLRPATTGTQIRHRSRSPWRRRGVLMSVGFILEAIHSHSQETS